jgi:hypothetical protein
MVAVPVFICRLRSTSQLELVGKQEIGAVSDGSSRRVFARGHGRSDTGSVCPWRRCADTAYACARNASIGSSDNSTPAGTRVGSNTCCCPMVFVGRSRCDDDLTGGQYSPLFWPGDSRVGSRVARLGELEVQFEHHGPCVSRWSSSAMRKSWGSVRTWSSSNAFSPSSGRSR